MTIFSIVGRGNNSRCLTWRQRLRIALESAQGKLLTQDFNYIYQYIYKYILIKKVVWQYVDAGLEYLHKGCNPPLIHRDVKPANILLNANLEAKIADFGLLKAFNSGSDTHVSTDRLVGTTGYTAPE
jgi:serine/threonine protein kinase